MKRLEEAKKLGDFLYVGIWDDEMTRFYRGKQYPIVSIQERVLMCLACKHIDDVVIGAPFILTDDLIKSLNIKKVVHVKNTKEDYVLKRHEEIDQLAVARKLGIVHEISIDDDFYKITTEEISLRVLNQHEAFTIKIKAKQEKEKKYNAEKEFIQEF